MKKFKKILIVFFLINFCCFLFFLNNLNSASFVISNFVKFEPYYSRLLVGFSLPPQPQPNDLFYNINDNTLQKYDPYIRNWVPVDWQSRVRMSSEWIAGRLRINSTTGRLQISPDGINWYDCIPAVGAPVIELQNYNYNYWIAPGQTVIIKSEPPRIADRIPIVYAKDVVPFFSGVYFFNNSTLNNTIIGLRPSNATISDGDIQYVLGSDNKIESKRTRPLNIVPIFSHSNFQSHWANFELRIFDNRFYVNAIGQSCGGFTVLAVNNSGSVNSASYWLGTWYTHDGRSVVMTYLVLTRRA